MKSNFIVYTAEFMQSNIGPIYSIIIRGMQWELTSDVVGVRTVVKSVTGMVSEW
ncbi:hypothetical protein [Neptuniibacter sp. 2_MG-2023]|jgi:hypothetical protein|uniref:hypothetical protein n=1 Tax=Neptuniibacter sp. 2_MG-2023 TaxID=3062671 RepID=UPI0026E1AA7D|nr:hypothetical protein [Neptuniibacter sp. 2_MG-2023]MDO6515317.1 hypothetical protein [Neptuniibacter sp. 2_MG-2023]